MAIGQVTVEGHAIVSADGMIADAHGEMPPVMRNEADWRFFQAALDRAALVVLGRLGHQRHPNPRRQRLVLTRSVAGLERDARDPRAHLWNPVGVTIDVVLERLGVEQGVLAVTGGTGAFDIFLPLFDVFVLAEVSGLRLPGGTPCFSGAPPGEALAAAGLIAGEAVMLDWSASLTQTVWRRG
jgi:hypothetical protein